MIWGSLLCDARLLSHSHRNQKPDSDKRSSNYRISTGRSSLLPVTAGQSGKRPFQSGADRDSFKEHSKSSKPSTRPPAPKPTMESRGQVTYQQQRSRHTPLLLRTEVDTQRGRRRMSPFRLGRDGGGFRKSEGGGKGTGYSLLGRERI